MGLFIACIPLAGSRLPGRDPEPGPDVLATDRPTVVLAAGTPTLISTPWSAPTSSAHLRQAVFLVDGWIFRYLPSPDFEHSVPKGGNCKNENIVGIANFANLVICPSGLENGEGEALITDMFGKHIYHTLGPEVGWGWLPDDRQWGWSPDDLHLYAAPDEEQGRKGTIYHLLTGELEDWPYTCDRVALSPRSGRLATWCRSVPQGDAFGVIEWGGETWISPQAPGEALVQTTPEIDRPGWLWGWAADGERIAYLDPSGNLTIANSQGAPLLVLPAAIEWQPFIDVSIDAFNKGPKWPVDGLIEWAANGERVLLHVRGREDKPCPNTEPGEVYENSLCWQVFDAQSGEVVWHQADSGEMIGLGAESSALVEGDIYDGAISADGRYLAMHYDWDSNERIAIVDVDTNTLVWQVEGLVGVWFGLSYMRWAEVPSDVSATPWPPTPIAAPPPSATLTPATMQGLALADPAALQTILWNYNGLWSPAYDEMVGQYKQPGAATIGLATAPDFSLRRVDLSQADVAVFDPTFSWSLDGNNILFMGPGEVNISRLWRMDRKGQNPRLVIPGDEPHFWQRFAGWLDERTVAAVVTETEIGYTGVYIIDFLAGKLLSWAYVTDNSPTFTPNRDYLPAANKETNGLRQIVIARQPQEEPYSEPYIDVVKPYAHAIPQVAVSTFLPGGRTVFKDWLPGSNQMLVQAFTAAKDNSYLTTSRLLLWDVDSDEVRDLAANGVDGKYSPDGRWLAAVTLGSLPLNADGTLLLSPVEPISKEATPFLYLLDTAAGEVVLNTAVIAAEEHQAYAPPNYVTHMAFSPDGRYLAFAAPGQVVADESGWPVGTEGESLSLNVLDLVERRLLRSLPGDGLALAWSPAGDRLAYRDSDLQWQVYNLRTDALVELTTSGGEMVERAAWSHSGRYLALYVTEGDGATHTVVLWMGE